MRIFKRLSLALCLLFATIGFVACGEVKVKSIYIVEDSVQVNVDYNDQTWSLDGMVVKAKLSNGKEKVITDYIIENNINVTQHGAQELRISYGVFEATLTITVNPIVNSYTLEGSAIRPKYNQNEVVDFTVDTVSLKQNKSNGTETIAYPDFTIATLDTQTIGTKEFVVTYDGETVLLTNSSYEVVKTLTSITIDNTEAVTYLYKADASYDYSTFTATAHYSDGSTASLSSSELDFDLATNELGNQTLIISYTDSHSVTPITQSNNYTINIYEQFEGIDVVIDDDCDTKRHYVIELGALDTTQFTAYPVYTKRGRLDTPVEFTITNLAELATATPTTGFTFPLTFSSTVNNITKTEIVYIKIVQHMYEVEDVLPTKIRIDESTLPTNIKWGDSVDFSNVRIIVELNNDPNTTSTTYIRDSKITCDTFSTEVTFDGGATTAIATLTVRMEGVTTPATCNITINRVLASIKVVDGYNLNYEYGATIFAPTIKAIYTDSATEFTVDATTSTNINTISTPLKSAFTGNTATVAVEYTYNYTFYQTTNSIKTTINYTITDKIASIKIVFLTDFGEGISANCKVGETPSFKIVETYVPTDREVDYIYEDNSKYTLEFDNTSAGNQELKVTLNGTTITTSEIVYVRDFTATSINLPASFTTYNSNSSTKNTYVDQLSTETTVKGFVKTATELNYVYKVGNDNAFKLSPVLTTTTEVGGTTAQYPIKASIYLIEDDEPTLIAENEVSNYLTIDKFNHTFTFNDSADLVGKKFKIVIGCGFTLTADEASRTSLNDKELTIEIVDGYNVYDAKDLSMIDNTNADGKWATDDMKTAEMIEKSQQINGVVLHNNITITKDDIPAIHFYSDTNGGPDKYQGADLDKLKGYMIDDYDYSQYGSVYTRTIKDGASFTIEGNFFTVDASSLPYVKYILGADEATVVTHTTMFAFLGDITGPVGDDIENCTINNISLIGNSQKDEVDNTDPDNPIYKTGPICYKTQGTNFTINNSLSQAWYIAHFFEGSSRRSDAVTHTIKNCTSFDAYNSLMYCWAARNVVIEDSYLIGAGGPVMICDQRVIDFNGDGKVDSEDRDPTKYTPFITNVTTNNSVLQSWVAGSEDWFVGFNATELAALLKASFAQLESEIDLKTQFGLTEEQLAYLGLGDGKIHLASGTLKNNKDGVQVFNLISVYKDGGAEGLTYTSCQGTFSDTNQTYGLDLKEYGQYGNAEDIARTQSFNGVMISANGTPVADLGKANPVLTDNTDLLMALKKFSLGTQYLGLYLNNGMGAVVGQDATK